ncbi:MAG TPA: hypothetical protein VLA34_13630 [Candidatus Krumholzibacterium sp.]|nr:hypothetical protein [Candidatus Krumholzibacterium sp.]
MRNNRKYLSLAIACVVLLLSFVDGKTEERSPGSDDYELMSLLIGDEFEAEFSLILIDRETEPWCLGGNLAVIRKTWPDLKSETIDALIIANREASCRLTENFRIPVDYRLVSEKEYVQVLQNGRSASGGKVLSAGSTSGGTDMDAYASSGDEFQPDWDNFDRVFPDAQGYLTFSRVGFDPDRTQALVIFSNSYRCSGTSMKSNKRKIACFMKRNGSWELVGISRGIDIMR